MTKRAATAFAAVLLLAGIAIAGPALAAERSVTLTADNRFAPGTLSVTAGDTVTWVWEGGFHDVTFGDGTRSGDPVGDVGTTFSRTFSATGSFSYICTVHEALGMRGTVTVVAAGAQLPFTGPEDTVLPLVGVLLVAAGAAWLLVIRRRA